MTDSAEAPELNMPKTRVAISMLDSMVATAEKHSGTSRAVIAAARTELNQARTDAYAEVTPEMREGVIDQIEQTISDTHDVDTTDRHYAENVFDNNIECISVAIHKELIHAREEAHAAGRAEALEEAARNIPSIMNEKGPFAPDIAKGIRALNKEQADAK